MPRRRPHFRSLTAHGADRPDGPRLLRLALPVAPLHPTTPKEQSQLPHHHLLDSLRPFPAMAPHPPAHAPAEAESTAVRSHPPLAWPEASRRPCSKQPSGLRHPPRRPPLRGSTGTAKNANRACSGVPEQSQAVTDSGATRMWVHDAVNLNHRQPGTGNRFVNAAELGLEASLLLHHALDQVHQLLQLVHNGLRHHRRRGCTQRQLSQECDNKLSSTHTQHEPKLATEAYRVRCA